MPTDKIIPRVLNISTDERLHQEGDMLDALNVTIDESGDGTLGVLKNADGTTAIPFNLDEPNEIRADSFVVGSVTNHDNNTIIFFVENASGTDGIYLYDEITNTYRVLEEANFGFNRQYPVKADIVNTFLFDDNQLDTLVYFTDNLNPPRKINVTRSLAGGYLNESGQDTLLLGNAARNEILSVCKGPIPLPPTFRFATDETVEANNFHTDFFQFATQLIYEDGEESAISPYSKIAYPDHVSIQGVEDAGTNALYKNDNQCIIDARFSPIQSNIPFAPTDYQNGYEPEYKYSVKKLRILARPNNGSAFYVIDEFDPYQEVVREIYGEPKVVYTPSSREYLFYNSSLYSLVPDRTVNKLFDNVPLKAEAQAIQGERLIYGNYTEGYPNFPVSPTIEVKYINTNEYGSSATGAVGSDDFTGRIEMDMTSVLAADEIQPNTQINISFLYQPQESSYISLANGDPILSVTFRNSSNEDIDVDFDKVRVDGDSSGVFISKTINVQDSVGIQGLFDLIQAEFAEFVVAYSFTQDQADTGVVASTNTDLVLEGDPIAVIPNEVTCNIEFSELELSGNTIYIKPFFSFVSFSNATLQNYTGFSPAFQTYANVSEHSDLDFTEFQDSYIPEGSVTKTQFSAYRTFKAGCSHDLGIVFYDEFNRSSFVNKIGSFYVDPFNDENRDVGDGTYANGPAYVSVEFPLGSTAPDWAKYYQLVYTGPTTFDSFTSYTTGGAYLERYHDSETSHPIRETSRKIYVSMKTLDLFVDDKGAEKSYTYTKGDILRVISYEESDGAVVFPRSELGNLIEFRVVGFEYLTEDHESNLINESHSASTADVDQQYIGSFVILEAPVVTSGQDAYNGFDVFSVFQSNDVTATHPYTQTDASYSVSDSLWGQKTTVEILTPTVTKEKNVYYEIGEARRLITRFDEERTSTYGDPIITNEGSAYLRPTSCLTPVWSTTDSSWNIDSYQKWEYNTIYLETDSITDYIESAYWSKGRAHNVYDAAGTYRRFNGITYSDRYAEDSQILTLANFNQSAFNWQSLEASYGAVRFLGRYSDNLLALQQNKASRIPVNANTVSYGDGSTNMTVSEQFLGRPVYYAGDYGVADCPESVIMTEQGVFFCDRNRKKVLKLGAEGIVPISENGVSSYITEQLSLFGGQVRPLVVGGYDPDSSTYYLTIRNSSPITIGYDTTMNRWRSRYSFAPTSYAHLGNAMYSFSPMLLDDKDTADTEDDIYTAIHYHNPNAASCTFYGQAYPSVVQVVSKADPSMMKVFAALTLECDNESWTANITTPGGQGTGNFDSWRVRERGLHHEIPRDTLATPTLQYIGTVSSIEGNTVTFSSPISSMYVPYGSQLYVSNQYVSSDFLSFATAYSMNVTDADGVSAGNDVYVSFADSGDPIRDYFCVITLTNDSTEQYELFSVNTHFDRSNLGAELSQK